MPAKIGIVEPSGARSGHLEFVMKIVLKPVVRIKITAGAIARLASALHALVVLALLLMHVLTGAP